MLEATFGDDTLIILRLGSTGSNLFSEATLVRCSTEQRFWENVPKFHENIHHGIFFCKFAVFCLENFSKTDSTRVVFFWIFWSFSGKTIERCWDNCLPDNCPLDNWPSDECLEDNRPRTMSPWPIAPKENCLSDCLLPA